MMPLTRTQPSTAIGTVRRGSLVSSASGAAASNPPKASTAKLNASSTSLALPPGQVNGVPDRPLAPPLARMVTLSASSSTTSNTYNATVTLTPNLSPTTTGATTRTPYTIVTSCVTPQKCTLLNTFSTMELPTKI